MNPNMFRFGIFLWFDVRFGEIRSSVMLKFNLCLKFGSLAFDVWFLVGQWTQVREIRISISASSSYSKFGIFGFVPPLSMADELAGPMLAFGLCLLRFTGFLKQYIVIIASQYWRKCQQQQLLRFAHLLLSKLLTTLLVKRFGRAYFLFDKDPCKIPRGAL